MLSTVKDPIPILLCQAFADDEASTNSPVLLTSRHMIPGQQALVKFVSND